MMRLVPQPLTRAAFARFGQVLETDGARQLPINQGTTIRFDGLAVADTGPEGQAQISIFRGTPRPAPVAIGMLERHPLASQAFFPLSRHDWLVVVAEEPEANMLHCFRATGDQGVQYAPGVWHHPLLVLVDQQDFIVVDRLGAGNNLEERVLDPGAVIAPE